MLNLNVKNITVATMCGAGRSLKNLLQSFRQDSHFLSLIDIRRKWDRFDTGKVKFKKTVIILDERKRY